MTGASLACGLARQNVKIALIEESENKPGGPPGYDDRGIALSLSSRKLFDAIGLWSKLDECVSPINSIHVSEKGRYSFFRMSAEQLHLESLGFVAVARELGRILMNELASFNNVELICPASAIAVDNRHDGIEVGIKRACETDSIVCKLLVIADGALSRSRELIGIEVNHHDYRQTAIVSNITVSRRHRHTAYERFTPEGIIALLPLTDNRCVSVFVVSTDKADACLQMPDEEYIRRLQERFGKRLGEFDKPGIRKPYPLFLVEPERQISHRTVLLGNAAHTIHPNGAQGFNLALRDVAALIKGITEAIAGGGDVGGKDMLERYVSSRQSDQKRVIRFTDAMADTADNTKPLTLLARGALMFLIDAVPELKTQFVKRATGIYQDQAVF